ncbi:PREDICTED: uncharacterized protein LOC104594079 isoform X2 [Nelumbo nucifera]|uniref:Uncharacterized protein LOC104594079 isoform X2 n=1 Tax=Nelumbo nucifera TaxID=4432 RepID=A0A1U7ZLB0_NELNU|nr:PREDICTED: uncharacterized protein LOC104594079 isoform X2 [Nelumbo nucifera]
MSFLAGRLAGTEGAYFLQESKYAVGRLVQKKKLPSSPSEAHPKSSPLEDEAQADVLPEVLRHSLPSKIFEQPLDSSLSTASKWVLPADPNKAASVSADAMNPLRAYLSMPQVTFGAKRWELPNVEHSVLASTANELRHDRYAHVNPEKLKAAAEGLSQVGKALAIATTIVFGGATLAFGLTASKLELHNSDDIRTKGRDLVQPKFEMVREQLLPVRVWVWRICDI